MSLQNAVPFDNPLPVMQRNMNAAVNHAQHVAFNVAPNIGQVYDKPSFVFGSVKEAINNAQANSLLPIVPPPIKVSRRMLLDAQWSMLVPFVIALFTLATMVYRVSTGLYVSTGNERHLSSLIPLVMIFGEPILNKALTICTASPRQDSPHFGCGWLSWSSSAILPALSGTRDLLPKPEVDSKVLNLNSGQGHANKSFVLSRVLRDLESKFPPKTGGLTIEILDACKPTQSLSWVSSMTTNIWTMAVMFTQLALAVRAFVKHGDESVMMIFATAVFLMEAIANMPAWRALKFSARKDGGKNVPYALMRGNGHRHVFIVRNTHKDAWNLEDLAGAGATQYDYSSTLELLVLIVNFIAFLILTLLSTLLSDQSVVYVLTILALGTFGNILTAALPRAPWMHGLALRSVDVISNDRKVMVALQTLEKNYPGLGEPLVNEFFPGGLCEEEQAWWAGRKEMRSSKLKVEEKLFANGAKIHNADQVNRVVPPNELDVQMDK